MRQADKHIYVHVPFCDGKCIYCGFFSELYDPLTVHRYSEALGREFDLLSDEGKYSPETLYFGGGTPSILSEEALEELLNTVLARVDTKNLREWTIEANPGTLSPVKLRLLKTAGVNRVSIGVQSFDDRVLKSIGRRHCSADVADAVIAVRGAGIKNIGIDLIACLPGVDDRLWSKTLEQALSLAPTHVSVYALTVENDTKLELLVNSGTVSLASDDHILRTIALTESTLQEHGFGRYEISNFCRSGYECLHNVSFWQGDDYLGFGPSASSRDGFARWTNRPQTGEYVSCLSEGVRPQHEAEVLSRESDSAERFMFSFRLAQGVDLAEFCRKHGVDNAQAEKWSRVLSSLARNGVVEADGQRWRLTSRGKELADYVAGELLVC
ncbi:MAG: hypothetical protein A2283_09570 [Lentisphaerae bacterium RIFOXYA12_FULL_48_11]|nr:MAG: hypothetical protein A2283_09570 [Lentisphaerae bacterium RIFOXYA12_FULL_48_11]